LPKNLVVSFKELEQKLNRLEINFYKKCQLSPSLCESNWKKWTFFAGDIFGRLKGKLTLHLSAVGQLKGKSTLQLSNETSENCRTGFPLGFTTS